MAVLQKHTLSFFFFFFLTSMFYGAHCISLCLFLVHFVLLLIIFFFFPHPLSCKLRDMLFRNVCQACGRVPSQTSPLQRWQKQQQWPQSQLLQRRWASSSSSSSRAGSHGHSSFRAGVVDRTPFQVKPNYSIPMWQPPARFMKYRAVRWLSNNLLALATYQLVLEAGFTVVFGSLLYTDKITAQGVCDSLSAYHYPFVNWIDVTGGVYTDPVKVGPFSLNPQKMTALHTGHNIANGLLPVQVVLLLLTFSPVHRLYQVLRHLPPVAGATVVGSAAASGAATGASTTAAATADTGAMARGGAKTAAAASPRRASYARPSSTRITNPRQPF